MGGRGKNQEADFSPRASGKEHSFADTLIFNQWPLYWTCILQNSKIINLYYCCWCSVAKLCPTLCDPMDWSTPGFPVLLYLLEFAQTHVHWVSDAIQPSHPLLPPSSLALDLTQHLGLFSELTLHQVAKVLELQLQHQSFQWIFRVDFL